MLSKKSRPMIRKLTELLVSGNGAGFFDIAMSPKGPLNFKIQSPGGLKKYDVGGIGLGIVAALDKSTDGKLEILAKHAISSPKSSKSDPIPVNSVRFKGDLEELERLENYTYVTCHEPNKTFTKVYYDAGDQFGRNRKCNNNVLFLHESSPAQFAENVLSFPTSDFLSSCNLCKKKLHGKDIYMYRGEKAFCSTECRSRQIMMDERKEQCRSEASRSADVSNSPYTRSQIFSTGILAI